MESAALAERRTRPRRPWRWWAWTGLAVLTVVHTLVMAFAAVVEAYATKGSCNDPASLAALHEARVYLWVIVAISVLPWLTAALVAARTHRPWVRWLLPAPVVVGVPVLVLVAALQATPAEWTGGFCF
ncbi:hypothetical protein ACFP8W_09085 [Nocardioides hankookensis]